MKLRNLALVPALALVIAGPAARPAHAQGVTVALSPGTQVVTPGTDFDVAVRVPVSGSAFNGFDARITYDPAALTLVPTSPLALQQGSLMTAACGNTFHIFKAGAGVDTVTDVLLCASIALTGPGTLYTLWFHASLTPQVTAVRIAPGSLKFYNAGLYVTPVSSTDALVGIGTEVTGVGEGPAAGALALAASPNPGHDSVAFVASGAAAGLLTVRDVQGRVLRALPVLAHRVAWDGRDDSGAPARAGIYFATLAAGGRTTTIRFSLIR